MTHSLRNGNGVYNDPTVTDPPSAYSHTQQPTQPGSAEHLRLLRESVVHTGVIEAQRLAPLPPAPPKAIFSLADLNRLSMQGRPPKLLDPFIPQTGITVVAGMEDSGKSMFLRHLALAVVGGRNEFCGFSLNPANRSAVYVATEDSPEESAWIFSTQAGYMQLDPDATQLQFVAACLLPSETPVEPPSFVSELRKETLAWRVLTHAHAMQLASPAGLLVMDSLGDMLAGVDSNSASAARTVLQAFNAFCQYHQCAVLFLHHLTKGSRGSAPDKTNLLGSGAISQFARCVIQIDRPEDNHRIFFTCVKGNAVSSQHKYIAHEFHFSEETFLFTPTGVSMPKDELMQLNGMGGGRRIEAKSSADEKWEKAIQTAFTDVDPVKGLKRGELIPRLAKAMGLKDTTINGLIGQLVGEEPSAPHLLRKEGEGKKARYFPARQMEIPF